ncbi:hypothetical protein KL909_005301 [Ogataea angusta]|nr:hypothetical protein KL909_005301 [Ogataea angusta]
MRFSSTLALATTVASVLAQEVTLYIDSWDTNFHGNGLEAKHEGAALDYLFLIDEADPSYTWNYNANTKKLTAKQGDYEFPITLGDAPYVAWGATPGYENYTFASDGALLVNGSQENFYACKDTNDPYGYSSASYELMYYKNPNDVPHNRCYMVTVTSVKPKPLPFNTKTLPISSTPTIPGSSTLPHSSTAPRWSPSSTSPVHGSGSVTSVLSRVTTASTQTHTVCPGNCSSSAVSTFENNAAGIAPAGAAVLGGMAVFFL